MQKSITFLSMYVNCASGISLNMHCSDTQIPQLQSSPPPLQSRDTEAQPLYKIYASTPIQPKNNIRFIKFSGKQRKHCTLEFSKRYCRK
jgi:hypothetical protein